MVIVQEVVREKLGSRASYHTGLTRDWGGLFLVSYERNSLVVLASITVYAFMIKSVYAFPINSQL